MNKAYRVVFNKATGVWMAVSEIARGRGKGHSKVSWTVATSAFVIATLASGGAWAAADGSVIDIKAGAGLDAPVAHEDGDIAIGQGAIADSQSGPDTAATAIGFGASAQGASTVALGVAAAASGDNALAIGANSSASGTGTIATGESARSTAANAIAIGSGSFASTASSVALGSNSVADRAAVTNLADPLSYSGSRVTTSTGAVSVGRATARRQIINVAAGTADTDAANVAQVRAIKNVVDANAVATKDTLGGGAVVGPDGVITPPTYTVGGKDANNVGEALGNLETATNTNIANSVTNLTTSINNGEIGLVQKDATTGNLTVDQKGPGTEMSFAGTDADGKTVNRKLTHVAAGTNDTDAVNVRQLKDTGLVSEDGKLVNIVTYDSDKKDSITLGNAGTPVKLSNVANGNVTATSTEAINGSQLHGTAQSVADALGGNAAVDAEGKVTKPTYVLSPDPISGKDTFDNVGDALSSLNNNIVSNAEAIDDLGTKIGEGSIGLVQQDKTSRTITVGKDTDGTEVNFAGKDADGHAIDRKLTHVAAGTGDTDAVNVRQLKDAGLVGDDGKLANAVTYDSDKKDSITLGGLKTDGTPATAPVKLSNVADGVNNNDAVNMGQLKPIQALANNAVQYDAGGTSVTFKGSSPVQLKNVAAGTDDTDAVNLKQLKDAGLVGQGEDGTVTSNAVLYSAADRSVARLAGADGTTLDNVKAGAVLAGSMQAINGSQLYGTYQDMAKALGGNAAYSGGVWTGPTYKFSDGEYYNVGDALGALDTRVGKLEGGSNTGDPAGGGGNGGAGGQANPMFASKGATATSKEAAVASGANSTAAGANAVASHDNSVALGAGSVTDRANSVSVGSVGNERAITNVAEGTRATDAVNKAQLDRVDNKIADVQQSIGGMQNQINQIDSKINRVGAISAAMSTMVASAAGLQTDNRMAIGTGLYRGQTALAIGYQRKISNRATVTIGGSTAGGSEYNVGVGAGFGW